MYTTTKQFSLFVQFPSNLPVAGELLDEGIRNSNCEIKRKQGEYARIKKLKDLLVFSRSTKDTLQP